MRKRVSIMLIELLLVTCPIEEAYAKRPESNTPGLRNATLASPVALPDLIVKEIVFEQAPSKVRVRIMNQGEGPASSCYVALQSLVGNQAALKTEQRVWTIQIPALEAGKGYSNVIDVSPLVKTNGPWRATVDRSNFVRESNENNNTLDYPTRNPGGVSPGRRLADLYIDHFELIDQSQGVVRISVANKGNANSVTCTLRLIVWKPGQFEQHEAKTVFVKVQALHPGTNINLMVTAGVPIVNTKYSMYIDISEEVIEINENNNRAEGEAGNYKP